MLQLLDYLLEFPLATLAEISYHVHRPGKKPVRRRQNVDMKDYLEPAVLTIAIQRYGGSIILSGQHFDAVFPALDIQ